MSAVRLPCKLPLSVAPHDAREYELVARAVRDQTVELYQEFLSGRSLEPTQWKREKQRETATVYVARERHPPTAFHHGVGLLQASPHVLACADFVPQLRLRLVGTMLGTLDDAMLGATAPSQLAMLMRSATLGDDFVDHRNLLDIRLPTATAPFTYTGLKWSVRKTAIASLVKARDMTHVEATGFTQIEGAHGAYERVGFLVLHSLSLSPLPPLDAQGLVRSKVSMCHLFRQASPGVVELFSTMALCPGGGMASKVATLQATDALFAMTKATESAIKKRLVWMQASRAQGAPKGLAECFPERPRRGHEHEAPDRSVCTHCARALSALRSVTTCEVCATPVCSRCVTSQKLIFGIGHSDVRVKSLAVCSSCAATAQRTDNAAALAVFEFVQPLERKRSKGSNRSRLGSYTSTAISSGERRSSTTTRTTTDSLHSRAYEEPLDRSRSGSSFASAERHQQQQQHSQHQRVAPGDQYQQRLWQQMNDLCLQAEQTYHTTAQHTRREDC